MRTTSVRADSSGQCSSTNRRRSPVGRPSASSRSTLTLRHRSCGMGRTLPDFDLQPSFGDSPIALDSFRRDAEELDGFDGAETETWVTRRIAAVLLGNGAANIHRGAVASLSVDLTSA